MFFSLPSSQPIVDETIMPGVGKCIKKRRRGSRGRSKRKRAHEALTDDDVHCCPGKRNVEAVRAYKTRLKKFGEKLAR